MDQVALVTGASRGIGRGIALALGELRWSVAVNYASNKEAAEEVVHAIKSRGGRAKAFRADIGVSADRARLVDETVRHFGKIDLLVNNAGVPPRIRADILEATEESFDGVIAVNLKGPYFLTQRVAREMIRTRKPQKPKTLQKSPVKPSPAIVTISSISAYTPSTNRGDYCIAKAGQAMLTKLWAARLAEYGINVYEIRPGIIETDMTRPVKAKYDKLIAGGLMPISRWGQPEDVAKAVIAIAMGLLPYSTGEVINVDGGFHLQRL